MKNFYLMTSLVAVFCLTSCGDNPTLDSLVSSKSVIDNTIDPLDPSDGVDGQDGEDGEYYETTPDGRRIFYRQIGTRDLLDADYVNIGELPYLTKKFPIRAPLVLEEPVDKKFPWEDLFGKNEDCGEDDQFPCIKNSQVVFGFDVPDLNWGDIEILDLEIRSDLFSHWKNTGTEIICLLNDKRCSGSAIRETPAIIRWLIKNRNPAFWEQGSSIVKNNVFMNIVRTGEDRGQKVYYTKNARIGIKDILEIDSTVLAGLVNEETLYFVVGDDTMLSSPVLNVKYVQR